LRAPGHGLSLEVRMAEQNLFGVAGGVARTGLPPYVAMIHIEVLDDRKTRSSRWDGIGLICSKSEGPLKSLTFYNIGLGQMR
jgi:hypothetical protein